ncbi:MAG TPA: LysM peptidoglycan-binding domain-containing protein, partial [Alphaproteobacteria bacterium]|nr:LysM peptidoglycan-binding domain-containing protein [Alphaproteobacteria bacterium]
DVVTVTPAGDAVIAGRGEPNAEITIRDGETELGTVQTDSKGTWIFVPEVPLPPGVRELDLVTKTPEGVEVHSGEVVVLMLPSRNLPQEMAVDDKTPATPLAILMSREGSGSAQLLQGKEPIHGLIAPESLTLDILNYEASGQVDFSGQGKPNSRISAYIDNELIGITTVMPDGTWQLVPTVQVALGLHTLRIDQIDLTGQVISRLETPFSMASFERPRTGEGLVIVQPGNSLWRIARRLYGQGIRYTMIFVANQDQIRDPALIYPGQIFIVPNEG